MKSRAAKAAIYCALDTGDLAVAKGLANKLQGLVGGIKLGLEFFAANGPGGVAEIGTCGLPIFLDLKLCDIPHTVARAIKSLLPLKPAILTLHGAGGEPMLRAAAQAASLGADELDIPRPKLVAVTVLTSMSEDDLQNTGVNLPICDQARRIASLAQGCGLDGAVCGASEVAALRVQCGPDFMLVVPGIRPAWADADDQKRVTTPAEALELGADVLVIGRPITTAADPQDAAKRIAAELEAT